MNPQKAKQLLLDAGFKYNDQSEFFLLASGARSDYSNQVFGVKWGHLGICMNFKPKKIYDTWNYWRTRITPQLEIPVEPSN